MGTKTPRACQVRFIDQSRAAFRTGCKQVVAVMPCGAGKTIGGWMAVEPSIEKGKRVVFVADRRVLVEQAARSAHGFGLPVGIVMADAPAAVWLDRNAPLQVVSKDTAVSWLKAADQGRPRPDLPPADFVIVDECHRSSNESWQFLRAAYPDAWELGLTATPVFPNGRGLGERYGAMVQPATYAELIAEGVILEPECYAPGSKVRRGRTKPTRAAMVGDAVFWWKRFAAGMRTFLFASTVAHSMALRDEFRKAGIPAEHMDADTESAEREEMFARLRRRETLLICNVGITRYGVDVQEVECCQLVTPMTSVVDFRQSTARVMRADPANPAKRAVVIDHAGALLYHGFPHADLPWSLDGDTDHVEVQRKRMEDGDAPQPIACPECHTLYSGRSCPGCGWEPRKQPKHLATKAGTLTRVTDAGGGISDADAGRAWSRALAVAANKGMPLTQAAAIFKRDAGKPPWEFGGLLDRLPPAGSPDWRRPAGEVHPEFVRRKGIEPEAA